MLASALLSGGLPAARRRRTVALCWYRWSADGLREKLGLVANPSPTPRYPRQLRTAVAGVPARPALRAVVTVSPADRRHLANHLRELRSRHVDPADPGVPALPGRVASSGACSAKRVVRLTVKPFMDMSTMIEERLLQCCVHVGTRSGQGTSARRSARSRPGRELRPATTFDRGAPGTALIEVRGTSGGLVAALGARRFARHDRRQHVVLHGLPLVTTTWRRRRGWG